MDKKVVWYNPKNKNRVGASVLQFCCIDKVTRSTIFQVLLLLSFTL